MREGKKRKGTQIMQKIKSTLLDDLGHEKLIRASTMYSGILKSATQKEIIRPAFVIYATIGFEQHRRFRIDFHQ